ncbi:hypothetical protein KJ628_05660 [Patescibacteria group bacterium]|nr:hypothetical protein [Patescibacteria group bacterium]
MSTTKNISSDRLKLIRQVCDDAKQRFDAKHQDLIAWMKNNNISFNDLRSVSQQILAATSLAGAVVFNSPEGMGVIPQIHAQEKTKDELLVAVTREEYDEIIKKLESIVQMPPGHMEKETELYLEQQLSDILGFEVTAELEGQRLNHSIGIMGGEQHLYRFPGDNLNQHDSYQEAGISPNRGAFSWFTENGELTENAIANEKYYFAVQTLYLPNWNSEYPTLKPWYKFRKMIVINPAEKIAVVGVVGDAGPAAWIQKQFGGSPEIIREGKIWSPKSRGRVLLLFVDDPDDKIPLGPISMEATNQALAEVESNNMAN